MAISPANRARSDGEKPGGRPDPTRARGTLPDLDERAVFERLLSDRQRLLMVGRAVGLSMHQLATLLDGEANEQAVRDDLAAAVLVFGGAHVWDAIVSAQKLGLLPWERLRSRNG